MIKLVISFDSFDDAFDTARSIDDFVEELDAIENKFFADVTRPIQLMQDLRDQIQGQAQIMEDENNGIK